MMNYVNLFISCLLIILVVIQIGNVATIDVQKKHEKMLDEIAKQCADLVNAYEEEQTAFVVNLRKAISQASALCDMSLDVMKRVESLEKRLDEIIKWQESLEEKYPSVDDLFKEIKNRNDDLIMKSELLNQEIQKGESAITRIVEYVDSITRMGADLNNRIDSLPDFRRLCCIFFTVKDGILCGILQIRQKKKALKIN